jgi:cell division protein FtsW (lipid II flippase)
MSIFRSEPMRLRSWAPKAASLTWRLYDFQLTTYAILLVLFGLAMAYSNSVGRLTRPSRRAPRSSAT